VAKKSQGPDCYIAVTIEHKVFEKFIDFTPSR